MANNEYEKAYNDARDILHRRGHKVGRPGRDPGGVRYCWLNDVKVTDYELMREAWGAGLADEIVAGIAEGDSLECCPEGNRLWREYSEKMRFHVRLLIERQIAESRRDRAALTGPASALEQVVELRQQNRQALLNHAATHI